MSRKLNIAIVGLGFGSEFIPIYQRHPHAEMYAICQRSQDKLDAVGNAFGVEKRYTSFEDLIRDPLVDAVHINSPIHLHAPQAIAALRAGKHVWLEKPMTETSVQARRLVEEAERQKRVLLVDHTFLYTGSVMKMSELIHSGEVGRIYYYDSTRVNLGLFQRDVSVISDLAVHDFSILDYLLAEHPVAVSASGTNHFPETPENLAYVTLFYDSGTIAHANVSWLAPVKVRQILLGGSKKMIIYDDLDPSEKIKVYDKGVDFTDDPKKIEQMRVGYRTGDMWAPQLEVTEALRVECAHFVDCISNHKVPRSDGKLGLRVVEIIEAANRSMRNKGETVYLQPQGSLL
jgi:predicted dehydrogenase